MVDGKDLSSVISNRLLSLTLTDARGIQSDTLQIELQDSTDDLALPPLTAKISLALGWQGSDLQDKGTYTVSELEYSGSPNKLTLTANSADLRATQKHGLSAAKSRSFHKTTLGELVEQIAKEHNLKSSISSFLKAVRIAHLDQTSESDISLLTRIANDNNAVVSVKHGTLFFITVGKGVSASGKNLPAIPIHLTECSSFSYQQQTREAYTGITTYWNNVSGGKRQKFTLGTTENAKELKKTYATEEAAQRAAQAEMERQERANKSLRLTLAKAKPEIEAESPLALSGFKKELQEGKWVVVNVTHTLSDGGFITSIEAEIMLK